MLAWAIIEYETGRHAAVPNAICRLGIPCVIPMTEEYQKKAQRRILRPALPRIAFVPADESAIQLAQGHIQYIGRAWRSPSGQLVAIPDKQFQPFMDGLAKREKRAKGAKTAINLADAAEKDWFALYAHNFGLQEAIRRFRGNLQQ